VKLVAKVNVVEDRGGDAPDLLEAEFDRRAVVNASVDARERGFVGRLVNGASPSKSLNTRAAALDCAERLDVDSGKAGVATKDDKSDRRGSPGHGCDSLAAPR
jgi:hypothetical protein